MDAIADAKAKVATGSNSNTATLSLGDKNWTFPVCDGTIGPAVVDIAKLYGTAGMFTYDPGFTSTASCDSISSRSAACGCW